MKNILAEIVAHKEQEVRERKRLRPDLATVATATIERASHGKSGAQSAFLQALSADRLSIIAEVKPKSPSAGALTANANDLSHVFAAYREGADALSVLTDEKYFDGSLALLGQARAATGIPVLCKDFFIDDYQLHEAVEAGADAILLIVKILDDESLQRLHQSAAHLGLTAVVEVQTEVELDRALRLEPEVVLINNRNLDTFEIDLDTTKRLAPRVPAETLVISASGIESRADIERLLPYAKRFLIGSSLMRSSNPAEMLKELRGHA